MDMSILLGVLLAGLLIVVLLVRRSKAQKIKSYSLQKSPLNSAQRIFFNVLREAVGDKAQIFIKLPAEQVLMAQAGTSRRKAQQLMAALVDQQFDFVLCHPSDFHFLAAINLEEGTHRHQKRKTRDLGLKPYCDHIGLPLLSIATSSHYVVAELAEQLLPLLNQAPMQALSEEASGDRREPTFNPLLLDNVEFEEPRAKSAKSWPDLATAQSANSGFVADALVDMELTKVDFSPSVKMSALKSEVSAIELESQPINSEPVVTSDSAPTFCTLTPLQDEELTENIFTEQDEVPAPPYLCPRCDAPLIEREAKKGPYAGRVLRVCGRFPECRYAAPAPLGNR